MKLPARGLLVIGVFLAASLTFAACGGSSKKDKATDSSSSSSSSYSSSAATSAPAATARPATTVPPAATSAPAAAAPAAVAPTAAAAAPASAAAAPTAVSIVEFAFQPASFNVKVGQAVTVNVSNTGKVSHTFTIAGVADSGTLSAGTNKAVQFTPTQAGTLTFFCNIHGQATMSGQITVSQ